MIPGIDVSHWQNDRSTPQRMDFEKAKAAGAKFVFIKVSERGGMDEDFMLNWKAAKAAGLLRGGYHFLRWDVSGLLQARIFCDLLKEDPGELPPVCDFEAPIKDGKYPSNAMLAQFLETVETTMHDKPMIYTSPGFWNTYGKNKTSGKFDAFWSYYPLWIAHYTTASAPITPEPWKSSQIPWSFWQYSSTGDGLKFGAESKNIDLNWFNGTQEELEKLAGVKVDSEAPPSTASTSSAIGSGSTELCQAGALLDKRVRNIENFLAGFKVQL